MSQMAGNAILGSPPRVRGTEAADAGLGTGKRITPACAGNSAETAATLQVIQDHPRVCGEQQAATMPPAQIEGSPPRVRGTEYRRIQAGGIGRITPACAGNSGWT